MSNIFPFAKGKNCFMNIFAISSFAIIERNHSRLVEFTPANKRAASVKSPKNDARVARPGWVRYAMTISFGRGGSKLSCCDTNTNREEK